jgi:hypothetical protein
MADRANFAGNMTQQRWLGSMKNLGCVGVTSSAALDAHDPCSRLARSRQAPTLHRRVQSGSRRHDARAADMDSVAASFTVLRTWTDRVAKGELRAQPSPQVRRAPSANIVVTLRDWMDEKHYLHDLISSDRRYPTVNANGPLYGSPEYSSDSCRFSTRGEQGDDVPLPVRDPQCRSAWGPGHAAA